MNADRLLAHYEKIADAPDAVQRLRRFILDLAVRGKLAEQDPNDEPASELLKRIAKEKTRLVEGGEIRRLKVLVLLNRDELPFPLPGAWEWAQIAELGVISPRNDSRDDHVASFVPMPMIPADYGATNVHEPRPWGEIKRGYTHFAESDVGLAKITPCFENGKSIVFRNLTGGIGSGTTELHVVRPIFVNADYIVLFLKSPHFIETGIPRMTGTAGQKRVPADYFANSPFPLPPLAEQHRIVAKVDELMALCDRLEAARTEREATRDRLEAASLARLNAPDPDPGVFQNHAAFALDNLIPLTTRPDQIKALRQTILNLAVRGNLVEQDPNDEPEAILLAGGKQCKPQESCHADTPGWLVFPVGALLEFRYGKGKKASERIHEGPVPVFGSNGIVGYCETPLTEAPSIIVGRKGSAGALNLCNGSSWTTDVAYFVEAPNFFDLRYLLIGLQALHLESLGKGVKPGLSRSDVYDLPLSVPPLAEQHRIVDKVDTLMALCNQMEANLASGDDTRCRLLDALLHEALAPRTEIIQQDIPMIAQNVSDKPPGPPKVLTESSLIRT